MSDRPILVSVVVPLYNKAAFIARTLKAIQDQDFEHFEVLVVNDGSTDDWQTPVAPFKTDSRFRFIDQAHLGVSAARNAGIRAARAPWISFLDADDYWAEDFLSSMVDLHQQHPGYDAYCAGRSYVVDKETIRYAKAGYDIWPIADQEDGQHRCFSAP